jgi:plastocyanin
MRREYGAPVDEATAARIVAYLRTYYTAPPPSDAEFLLAPVLASPAALPPGTPVPAAAGTPVLASPVAGQGPTLVLVDFAFRPNEFAIPANTPVTVTLRNTAVLTHNFSITDHNNPDVPDLHISVDVAPGQTGHATIDAPPGTYYFFCDIPGHEQAGMFGHLTVK